MFFVFEGKFQDLKEEKKDEGIRIVRRLSIMMKRPIAKALPDDIS